jgi:general nucleoside transport system permease protein
MLEVIFTPNFMIDLLDSTLRMATPLTYVGLACLISERSGILNIGVEGMMLSGAFAAAVVSLYTNSAWTGVGAAVLIGVTTGLLLAFLAVDLGADQIVSGLMINILWLGLSSFLARIFMRSEMTKKLPGLGTWEIPLLEKIPYIGGFLFQRDPLTYVSYVLVIVLGFLLFKTAWGLSIRAAGEHARAVDTAGISVIRLSYLCAVSSGALASLAGAFLSVGVVRFFTENMSAGRGFLGLIIVILGKWHPGGVLIAALCFGFVDALQLRLQSFDVGKGFHFLIMLPYICGLIAVSGIIGRRYAPAALGVPYHKEK